MGSELTEVQSCPRELVNQIVNHRGRENAPQHQDNPGGGGGGGFGGGGGGMPPMPRGGGGLGTTVSIYFMTSV